MSSHAYDPAATVRSYLLVFGALMVFTALTVAAAFVNMGALNNVIAISIAFTKAALVVAIFMHARGSENLIFFCIFGGLFFLALMFYFPLIDLLSRGLLGIPGK
ncbi:MAG TPA: cytochrome C oxidase subunit IV family protein [Candidatus Binatia bacterium]|jgi:cytochrome c oxidase subunit 4